MANRGININRQSFFQELINTSAITTLKSFLYADSSKIISKSGRKVLENAEQMKIVTDKFKENEQEVNQYKEVLVDFE